MLGFLIILHVIICLGLIFIVLIQTGKGGLDSNFGGIATNAFGTQGANEFIKRWTKILLIAFVLSCILLASQVRGGDEQGRGSRRRNRLTDAAQGEMQNVAPTENVPFDGLQLEVLPTDEIPADSQTESPAPEQSQVITIEI